MFVGNIKVQDILSVILWLVENSIGILNCLSWDKYRRKIRRGKVFGQCEARAVIHSSCIHENLIISFDDSLGNWVHGFV